MAQMTNKVASDEGTHMFGKHLKKSVATAAAVGAVLAVAATSTSGVVTAAPQIKNVACTTGYPNPAASNTNLSLTRPIQQYGQRNRANVVVTTGNKDATGSVRITVEGRSWTEPLVSGEASHALPRRLNVGSHTVRARYLPDCATGEVAPSGDVETLTVGKAETRISSRFAPDIQRGAHPRVRAIVKSTVSPGGSARVTISKGDLTKSKVVSVERIGGGESSIRARFGRVYKLGQWNVTIKYLGTSNFQKCREFTGFDVTR
jgi:hypothetical protein